MSESARIAEQLRKAFEGDAWHGPAVKELLSGVTAPEASARPISGAHSIWELVNHIGAWKDVVRRRLSGERTGELEPSEDFPPVDGADAASWEQARRRLEDGNRLLMRAVSELGDGRLAETVAGKTHTVYDMLHGLIQHDLYHAGQIAVLKKALVATRGAGP